MASHDEILIFLLGQARHRLYAQLDRSLIDDVGVTTAQLGALRYLMDHDGCQLIEFSRGMMLDKSAITRMAKRLEAMGFIERRPCPQDRRSTRVHITPYGIQAVQQCMPAIKAMNESIKKGFRPSHIRMFSRMLQKIITTFSE